MTGLEDLKGAVAPVLCVIGRALRDIPAEYKPALQNLVDLQWADGGHTDDSAAAIMRSAGIRASATSLRLHRRGFCTCI